MPSRASIGSSTRTAFRPTGSSSAGASRSSSRRSRSRSARPASGQQASFVLDTGHGLSTEEQEYNPTVIINDLRQEIERWRALPNPDQWQVTPVTATLLRHWRALQADTTPGGPPVLLPGRGGRDGDLAARGRAEERPPPSLPRLAAPGQRRRQPGPLPHRPEARDRRRQDHRHGDADRLAGDQRRPQPGLEDLLARLPRHHPRHHHPRPPARADAERPRLLPRPRPRAGGHADRPRPRQGRHHQLPRLPAPRDDPARQRHPRRAQGPRPRHRDEGDRGRDAPAGDGRPDGHEERRRPQRRGAPLLPRAAGGRGRRSSPATSGRRPRRTRRPPASGSPASRR